MLSRIITTLGSPGTRRGEFSIFKTLIWTHKSIGIRPIRSSFIKGNLFVRGRLDKNYRHLGFSIGQSDRMYLLTM